MSTIFISHNKKDAAAAEELKRWLWEETGHKSIFLDVDPEDGLIVAMDWKEQLLRKLRFCRIFLAVVTANWLSSKWCFAEYTHALSRGKRIFLLKYDDAEFPPELTHDQYVDLSQGSERGFKQLARGLREADADPRSGFELLPGRPVYPGTAPFEEEDAAVFFGRDTDIEECLGKIEGLPNARDLLLIHGASGVGKSSLLKAGIVPWLRRRHRDWHLLATFEPGNDGVGELVELVWKTVFGDRQSGAEGEEDKLEGKKRFREKLSAAEGNPRKIADTLGSLLRDWRRNTEHASSPILIFIDQLEESLADQYRTLDPEDGNEPRAGGTPLVPVLANLLRSGPDKVAVVATLRTDSLDAFQRVSVESKLDSRFFPLGPIDRTELVEVIAKPAEIAEIDVDDGLPGLIVSEIETGEALTLLAFTLSQLYERYGRGDQKLEMTEYEDLGGVAGAVQTRANGVLGAVEESKKMAVKASLLAMVGIDAEGKLRKRGVAWADLPEEGKELIKRLVDEGLLVRRKDTLWPAHERKDTLWPAHESIFEAWEDLSTWIASARGALRKIDEVRVAASEWDRRDRAPRRRWSDERVVEGIKAYQEVQAQPPIGSLEREFLGPMDQSEMLEAVGLVDTSHEQRASIGVRLSLLGDERQGVSARDGVPDVVWCAIPEGVVVLRNPTRKDVDEISDSREDGWISRPEARALPEEGREFQIPAGLEIAKYPTTWAQLRPFLEERDGFDNSSWWPGGRLEGKPTVPPKHLDNHPATGVSWFMAVAYCNWASSKFGREVRLPTEWEWQQAATGGKPDEFRYPWAGPWDPDRTNTWESGLRRTTAVGMYPQSASPVGAMDMPGNVWEWCLNKYADPKPELEPEFEGTRAVKGGSCIVDGKKSSRTGYTGKLHPGGRYVTGIRLVRV